MKHILFVENMNCEGCKDKIARELENTRVDFNINLRDKSVIIEGSNDAVYAAKRAIQQAGYTVK